MRHDVNRVFAVAVKYTAIKEKGTGIDANGVLLQVLKESVIENVQYLNYSMLLGVAKEHLGKNNG